MVFENRLSQPLRGLTSIWKLPLEISTLLQVIPEDFACCNVARFHISNPLNKTNFYEALEITPKATSGQIKKAYYKLSLIFHPDQNKTESAAIKFREITEAYEVLGNNAKRKLYDKGLFGVGSAYTPQETASYSRKVAHFRSGRSQSAPASGRTPIYDFDDWSKSHYTASFQRQKRDREVYERIMYQHQRREGSKGSLVGFGLVFLIFAAFYYYIIPQTLRNIDVVKRKEK